MDRARLADVVRKLVMDSNRARFEGGLAGTLAKKQGFADGYMRALMDMGVFDQKSLLKLVVDARHDDATIVPELSAA